LPPRARARHGRLRSRRVGASHAARAPGEARAGDARRRRGERPRRRGARARAGIRSHVPAQMTYDRRRFLQAASLVTFAGMARVVAAADAPARKLLVLVELKGGNDGLNTVIPYADSAYAALRPRIAIARDQVVQLTESTGLHPSLAPLLAFWDRKELAVVQG